MMEKGRSKLKLSTVLEFEPSKQYFADDVAPARLRRI
jgi:hypothetical protein